MKTKIKLLMGLLMVALLTGCQTKITYTSPTGDTFTYVRPWLDRKEIAELHVSGDESSREFTLKGYSSKPEWEAIPVIIGSAIQAGIAGAGKGVAP